MLQRSSYMLRHVPLDVTDSNSHKFIAVACPTGVYIAQKGEPAFRKVLSVYNPSCLVALPAVNKFFVLHDQGLYAYSLDLVARATLGITNTQNAEASKERIAGDVLFFRAGRVGNRLMGQLSAFRNLVLLLISDTRAVLYVSKRFLQYSLYALEVVNSAEMNGNPRRSMNGHFSFRAFGEPVSIPRETYDIITFKQRIVICSEKGLSIVDPTKSVVFSPRLLSSFFPPFP